MARNSSGETKAQLESQRRINQPDSNQVPQLTQMRFFSASHLDTEEGKSIVKRIQNM